MIFCQECQVNRKCPETVSLLFTKNIYNSTDKGFILQTGWLRESLESTRCHTIITRILFQPRGKHRPGKPTHESFGFSVFCSRENQ